jgi:hypothetical protein
VPAPVAGFTLTLVPTGLAVLAYCTKKGDVKKAAERIEDIKGINWGSEKTTRAALKKIPPKWLMEFKGRVILAAKIASCRHGRGSAPLAPGTPRPTWKGPGSGKTRWVKENISVNTSGGLVKISADVLYPFRHWAVHKTLI